MQGLNDIIEPIQKRKTETVKRPEQIKLLQDALAQVETLALSVEKSLEEAAAKAEAEMEAAPSSVESAASSVASEASEGVASATEAASSFAYGNDSEAESSSATPSPSPSASPINYLAAYAPEDLTWLTSTYDEISDWLKEKLALQDELGPSDDPAVLSSDLEAKAKQLNKVVTDLLKRKINHQESATKASQSKTSKTKTKSKGKKGKSSTSETQEAATQTAEEAEPTPEVEPSPSMSVQSEATPSTEQQDEPTLHDEL